MASKQGGSGLIQLFAVSVVVIIISAVAPPLIAGKHDPGVATAHYQSRDIGFAMVQFYQDTGHWPNRGIAGTTLLALLSASAAPAENGGAGHPAMDHDLLANHLVNNHPADGVQYPTAGAGDGTKGWRGPYLTNAVLDPWGNPYRVYMVALADNPPPHANKAVVLSSGPNGKVETPAILERDARFGGDDIGMSFFIRDNPDDHDEWDDWDDWEVLEGEVALLAES